MLAKVEARPEDNRAERDEVLRKVRELGEQELPDREWRIRKRRFGLNGDRPVPTEVIAAEMGVTPSRIRQVIACAVARLREECELRGVVVDQAIDGPA